MCIRDSDRTVVSDLARFIHKTSSSEVNCARELQAPAHLIDERAQINAPDVVVNTEVRMEAAETVKATAAPV